jgi:hypothetical protein
MRDWPVADIQNSTMEERSLQEESEAEGREGRKVPTPYEQNFLPTLIIVRVEKAARHRATSGVLFQKTKKEG